MVQALRGEGWVIHPMQEVYPSSDRRRRERFQDEVWIRAVTAKGWVILSKDGFRLTQERRAIAECGARVFSIPKADLRAEHMVERFLASQDAIYAHCQSDGPFMYSVYRSTLQQVTLPNV